MTQISEHINYLNKKSYDKMIKIIFNFGIKKSKNNDNS